MPSSFATACLSLPPPPLLTIAVLSLPPPPPRVAGLFDLDAAAAYTWMHHENRKDVCSHLSDQYGWDSAAPGVDHGTI
jgi:hypothetical protein